MESFKPLGIYIKPYRNLAVIAPLLMVVEVVCDLMLPRLLQTIVDQGIAQGDLTLVLRTGLLMILVTSIGAVGGIGCTVFAVRAAMNFGADLRIAAYRKVQTLSFGNLDKLGTAELVTRLTNDVNQVQEMVLMGLRILVRAPLLVVGSLIMAIITSPRLALLLIVLMALLILMLVVVIRRAFPLYTRLQERLDRVNTVIQENLSGARVVKAFVRGEHENERFRGANDALMGTSIQAMQLSVVTAPFMVLAINAGVVSVIWLGGIQTIQGSMTTGEIIAFVNYLRQTLMSLMMVSMLMMRISRAQASGKRVVGVLTSEPEVQDRPEAQAGFTPQGRVTFEHVSFGYNGGEPILQDVSFVAEPGQTVALLGATGSGKSSLTNLIPRFYDVNSGAITIDGVDVRDVPQAELRAHIGVALQEAVLFSGTIRDNIRQGRLDASEQDVIAAAQAAQAHDFISALPEGYDTQLGQRGVNLSGGQKQRLSIARALIRKPTILILDDSTSAVDVETESKIQAALAEIMRGRTSFIVAQRISTVLTADKILVLDDGRIVAEGTHHDLMASSEVYREIYESQLGGGTVTSDEVTHVNA
ncbi:MAG TPA: ABC transporter ATP-binding protein [Aggregatilinea sp.]|uniref:ABC transporter ATP-binding protein n=1 Tax=Aggregatilinea sp. TaxID=2806333 RepID=UPI002C8202C8|nr:ABC transporter ATP-binding protein [Aggregatilinea sp.]HML21157.1 ABC transporter ATP-binding protein [Aggregatilinea sp.]